MAAVFSTLTSKDFLARDIVACYLQIPSAAVAATTQDTGDTFTITLMPQAESLAPLWCSTAAGMA